jgi:hypothetical protein
VRAQSARTIPFPELALPQAEALPLLGGIACALQAAPPATIVAISEFLQIASSLQVF